MSEYAGERSRLPGYEASGPAAGRAPGKQTLTERLPANRGEPVQRSSAASAGEPDPGGHIAPDGWTPSARVPASEPRPSLEIGLVSPQNGRKWTNRELGRLMQFHDMKDAV